ncbi:hypothetical protein B9479_006437, partial [Cryptococcus floricola]
MNFDTFEGSDVGKAFVAVYQAQYREANLRVRFRGLKCLDLSPSGVQTYAKLLLDYQTILRDTRDPLTDSELKHQFLHGLQGDDAPVGNKVRRYLDKAELGVEDVTLAKLVSQASDEMASWVEDRNSSSIPNDTVKKSIPQAPWTSSTSSRLAVAKARPLVFSIPQIPASSISAKKQRQSGPIPAPAKPVQHVNARANLALGNQNRAPKPPARPRNSNIPSSDTIGLVTVPFGDTSPPLRPLIAGTFFDSDLSDDDLAESQQKDWRKLARMLGVGSVYCVQLRPGLWVMNDWDSKRHTMKVRDVYYVPNLRFNLLSSARLMAVGATVSLHNYAGLASRDGAEILRLQYRSEAWILDVSKVPSAQVACPPRALPATVVKLSSPAAPLPTTVVKLSPPAAPSGKAAPLEIWHRPLVARSRALPLGEATRVFDELEKEWRLTRMGEAKFILGLKIQRDRQARKVWLSQPAYIDKCCETFSSETMNRHVTTPLPYNIDEDESHSLVDATPYRKAVGMISWVANCTRPDVAYAASILSRTLAEPSERDFEMAMRTIGYLRDTRERRLDLGGAVEGNPVMFADADYAGDVSTRRSTTGWIGFLHNSPVTWISTFVKVHMDLCDMGTQSAGGCRYMLVIVDDYSRWVWGFFLAKKRVRRKTFGSDPKAYDWKAFLDEYAPLFCGADTMEFYEKKENGVSTYTSCGGAPRYLFPNFVAKSTYKNDLKAIL